MKCRCLKSICDYTTDYKIFKEGEIYDYIEDPKFKENPNEYYRYRIINGNNQHNTDSLIPNFIPLDEDRENKLKDILN